MAVKKLPENATAKNFYDLFKELKLMFQVGQHPNIVNLIGYCIDASSLLIVTDFARYGNLKDFLRSHAPNTSVNSRHLRQLRFKSIKNNENNNTVNKDEEISQQKITREHLLLYAHQISLGMEYLHSKQVKLFYERIL